MFQISDLYAINSKPMIYLCYHGYKVSTVRSNIIYFCCFSGQLNQILSWYIFRQQCNKSMILLPWLQGFTVTCNTVAHSQFNPTWHGLFWTVSHGGHQVPLHNFVVITLMIMKFDTSIKIDVFYTIVAKKFVISLLSRNYGIIICVLADA